MQLTSKQIRKLAELERNHASDIRINPVNRKGGSDNIRLSYLTRHGVMVARRELTPDGIICFPMDTP